MPSALPNLHTLSISLPPHKRGTTTSVGAPNRNGVPLHRLLPSPLRRPIILAVKAMEGGEARDSLDHLQRANKVRQQQQSSQQPKRRVAQSAPIGLWDRFPNARTVQQMMDTMDRIIEDPFAYNGGAPFPSLSGGDERVGGYRRGRTPWEIKEGEGEYKMRFDMPGMTRKDVKVYVEERMLVVKAEKEEKAGEEEEEVWSPKSYGRYSSRIALPDNVEVERIGAEVKDGVLYITIPKVSPSSKVLDIDVK